MVDVPLAAQPDVELEIGHGSTFDRTGKPIFDPGCLGPNDTTEHELSVKRAYEIKRILELDGHKVIVTDPAMTLYQISRSATGRVFVSLHLNAFNKKAQGTRTLVSSNAHEQDTVLAAVIQHHVKAAMQLQDRGVAKQQLAVLSTLPPRVKAACLTEPFFLDSCTSLDQVLDFNQKAALGIAEGIHQYLQTLK